MGNVLPSAARTTTSTANEPEGDRVSPLERDNNNKGMAGPAAVKPEQLDGNAASTNGTCPATAAEEETGEITREEEEEETKPSCNEMTSRQQQQQLDTNDNNDDGSPRVHSAAASAAVCKQKEEEDDTIPLVSQRKEVRIAPHATIQQEDTEDDYWNKKPSAVANGVHRRGGATASLVEEPAIPLDDHPDESRTILLQQEYDVDEGNHRYHSPKKPPPAAPPRIYHEEEEQDGHMMMQPPPAKRPRRNDDDDDDDNETNRLMEIAKARGFSKFGQRLFDPNRPRGLVQTPQTIPWNDTYLQDFGRRQQQYNKTMGVNLEIDREILDDDDHVDYRTIETAAQLEARKLAEAADWEARTKVKISNLKFTTQQETLLAVCAKFGPIKECNVLLNETAPLGRNGPLNRGLAYVTFEEPGSALACIEDLQELDGRSLRVALCSNTPSRQRQSAGGANSRGGPGRYWLGKDLGLECHRCGQVGHFAADCTNEPMAKPCPLCSKMDHDIWKCPYRAICFNCGLPGHVVSQCTFDKINPRRICSVCFRDHHRFSCPGLANVAFYAWMEQGAFCMSCGEKGHFQCKPNSFDDTFYGQTCSNCGSAEHALRDCQRPTADIIARKEHILAQLIDDSEAWETGDEDIRKRREFEEAAQRRREAAEALRRQQQRDDERRRGRGRGLDPRYAHYPPEYQPPPPSRETYHHKDHSRRSNGRHHESTSRGSNSSNHSRSSSHHRHGRHHH